MSKPIICLDFDGVIHSYERGWQGGEIYGSMIPGFLAWSIEAQTKFELVIYSSRSKDLSQIAAMIAWMLHQVSGRMMPNEINNWMAGFTFSREKPPAFLTIDDRAIQFTGNWASPELRMEDLLAFKPWNHQAPMPEVGWPPIGGC